MNASSLSPATIATLQAQLPPGLSIANLDAWDLSVLMNPPKLFMNATTLTTTLLFIYASGIVLNGIVLIVVFLDSRRMLKSSMDRLTTGLVSVCFIWSVGRGVIHALQGVGYLSLRDQGAAAFSNVMVIMIFCLNINLAMERYFQINNFPYAIQMYTCLYTLILGCIGTVLWTFFSSTTFDGLKPDSHAQLITWISLFSTMYALTIGSMAWFYTRTYQISARQFAENPQLASFFLKEGENDADPHALEIVRLRVERQILGKCLLLSLALVICYAPFYAYEITVFTDGIHIVPTFDANLLFYTLCVIFLAADVVITPLLVFVFMKDVRKALMFWKK